MKILSIETSCDDTCISVLEMHGSFSARGGSAPGGKILANNSNSQINLHIPYGGVFPALAKREHIRNLPLVLEESLKQAHLNPTPDPSPKERGKKSSPSGRVGRGGIDLIAVTYGPGLEPCLWTGIVFAKELSQKWKVPIIPVNHMEGHILSVFGKGKGQFKIGRAKLPALALLVSGGHTELVLIKGKMSARGGSAWGGDYKIIGETLDDAVGEAFDKAARMLGLPYPGGPQISKLAEELRNLREGSLGRRDGAGQRKFSAENFRADSAEVAKFLLPRPMLYTKDFNFSFSGLKTAVLYLIQKIEKERKLDEATKAQIALEFENAAIECLVRKTAKAMEKYKIKTLIVGGGVSANEHLRRELKTISRQLKAKLLFPPKELSMDNSIMIGIAGYLNYIKNKKKVPRSATIKAKGSLRLGK